MENDPLVGISGLPRPVENDPLVGIRRENMRSPKQRETQELLGRFKSFLSYDPRSGNLVFTDTRYGAVEIGAVAGYMSKTDGYIRVYHRGEQYMAHRIAWALQYGDWPQHTIDHINKDASDNRLENLRDVPQAVNNTNKSRYKKRA
jgi:hypothetical protein